MINIKKTTLATAIATTLAISNSVSADIITMSFSGLFTITNSTGAPQLNADDGSNQDYGFRTNITGMGSFDTATGAGSAAINPFSFFGSGMALATSVSFQTIGDGTGGAGSLIAGVAGLNWNGASAFPFSFAWDASGFFNSMQGPGSTWSVGADCVGCTTSATADWAFASLGGTVGAVPMAMTNYNTNIDNHYNDLNNIFPLVDDGISGSPMTTAPFPGFNINLDFTSITATNTAVVPVPAAVWLFGSGLIGLVGVARRRTRKM